MLNTLSVPQACSQLHQRKHMNTLARGLSQTVQLHCIHQQSFEGQLAYRSNHGAAYGFEKQIVCEYDLTFWFAESESTDSSPIFQLGHKALI